MPRRSEMRYFCSKCGTHQHGLLGGGQIFGWACERCGEELDSNDWREPEGGRNEADYRQHDHSLR
jgi:ribosomal protein L37AE/L43A